MVLTGTAAAERGLRRLSRSWSGGLPAVDGPVHPVSAPSLAAAVGGTRRPPCRPRGRGPRASAGRPHARPLATAHCASAAILGPVHGNRPRHVRRRGKTQESRIEVSPLTAAEVLIIYPHHGAPGSIFQLRHAHGMRRSRGPSPCQISPALAAFHPGASSPLPERAGRAASRRRGTRRAGRSPKAHEPAEASIRFMQVGPCLRRHETGAAR
jgi:hypothetical protein